MPQQQAMLQALHASHLKRMATLRAQCQALHTEHQQPCGQPIGCQLEAQVCWLSAPQLCDHV